MDALFGGQAQLPVTLVAALARRSRAIGVNNRLPWHLPADLAYFKRMTMHKTVLMGRKTYLSIGRPLPQRHNIVVTRDRQWRDERVQVYHDLDEVIRSQPQDQELMVIGGSEVYKQTLPYATRLLLTFVDWEGDADAFFPDVDLTQWRIESSTSISQDDENECDAEFVDFRLLT